MPRCGRWCCPHNIMALVAMGAAAMSLEASAERVVNSFAVIEGEGIVADGNGGVIRDAHASGTVTVSARSGWLVNGRESIVYPNACALSGLMFASRLGEDHWCMPPPPTKRDVHHTNFVFKVGANPTDPIAMYALPATSAVVTVSAQEEQLLPGKHRVTMVWEAWRCPVCGATQEARTNVSDRVVLPDTWMWESTAAGHTIPSNTWSGAMSKGLNQEIKFTLTGKKGDCRQHVVHPAYKKENLK